ncbi:carbamoyl phosphate synthase small subunit [Bacillaceae bacterium Marseille-Q3522]|nr:carbamoyl phosphate synthase small subunit [Bacillaceae bacterium Marseille-Q3522]
MKGYIHVSSGECFSGKWIIPPAAKKVEGEIVFFTGMTGYQEVLTDPSYKDQIIVFTYPLIGNYGINAVDFESKKPHVAGVVVYQANQSTYHYQAEHSFVDYLKKWNIPLIAHVDTRAIVKKIRKEGTMPALLSTSAGKESFQVEESGKVAGVSSTQIEVYGNGNPHIVLFDYGKKMSILRSLLAENCKVTVVPYHTSFQTIQKLNPDGVLLSNGPGDPMELKPYLHDLQKTITSYPTLGICLGHQLVALALGGKTEKLTFGHRGANHPVMDLQKGKVFMSSQNHSYVVAEKALKGTGLKASFYNLHDKSIEGLVHEKYPIITVQFHPEAHPGPAEGHYIFDEFLDLVKQSKERSVAYA